MSNHENFVEYVGDILRQCATTHSRPLVNLTMTMNHVRLGHHPETGQSGYLVDTTGQMEPHFVASSELGTSFEYEAVCADTERLHNTMQDQYARLTGGGETADSGQSNEAEFEYASGQLQRESHADIDGKAASVEDHQPTSPARQPAEPVVSRVEEMIRNRHQPTVEEITAQIALPEPSTRNRPTQTPSLRYATEAEYSTTNRTANADPGRTPEEGTRNPRRYPGRTDLEQHEDFRRKPRGVGSPELG